MKWNLMKTEFFLKLYELRNLRHSNWSDYGFKSRLQLVMNAISTTMWQKFSRQCLSHLTKCSLGVDMTVNFKCIIIIMLIKILWSPQSIHIIFYRILMVLPEDNVREISLLSYFFIKSYFLHHRNLIIIFFIIFYSHYYLSNTLLKEWQELYVYIYK